MPAQQSNSRMIGEYQIKGRPLGTGGMATVYLVTKNGKEYAAKVMHQHLNRERKTVTRFKQEYEIGLKMKANKAFVKMIELEKINDSWTIIMEYVPGVTLHSLLSKVGTLPIKDAGAVTYELANALSAFHKKNYIHRDLKPDNIIISPCGQVKIMDYGVTRDLGTKLTKTGTAIGTPLYMAPEQICGSKATDARCDIYSLGLIFYRLLSRRDAHGMKNSFEFIELVETRMKKPVKKITLIDDEKVFELIQKCLTPKPDDRFASTADLCKAMERTSAYSKSPKQAIKSMMKNLDKVIEQKKQAKIDKTIIQEKPASNKLLKLVFLSGLLAATAIGIALALMGPQKLIEVAQKLITP